MDLVSDRLGFAPQWVGKPLSCLAPRVECALALDGRAGAMRWVFVEGGAMVWRSRL